MFMSCASCFSGEFGEYQPHVLHGMIMIVNPESNGAIAGTIYSYLVDGNLVYTLIAVLSEVFVYRNWFSCVLSTV